MANIVTFEKTVNYDNSESYCSAEHAEIHVDGTTGKCAYEMYMDGKSGTVYLNDAYKEIIYPSDTARPFQLETGFTSRRYATSATQRLYLGGTEVWSRSINSTSVTSYDSGIITNDAIPNSTRSSELRWDISVGSTVMAVGIRSFYIRLYFYQYQTAAFRANDARGVDGISVSSSIPYQGEAVTFTAQLNSKSNWKGWYADAEHTQLVSTDINYTVVAGEDLSLYAYATKRQDVDFKLNGEWKEGIVLYKKENGEWVEISKEDIDTTIGYLK